MSACRLRLVTAAALASKSARVMGPSQPAAPVPAAARPHPARCPSPAALAGPGYGYRLRAGLRELIDPVEDQVRRYPLDGKACRGAVVLGARMIQERQDFWIVT